MSVKAPVTRLATLAVLAGIVAAFLGAVVVGTARPDVTQLPPEHPLFGR
jgi:hypothetical protein